VRDSTSGDTERCYQTGLLIYHTNWRCCTSDYDSELKLVIIFLVHLCTCRQPNSFIHLMCATLFLFTTSFRSCTQREIVTLSELQNPLLCNKFHCYQNGQTVASFSLSFHTHSILCSGQWTARTAKVFIVNECIMS